MIKRRELQLLKTKYRNYLAVCTKQGSRDIGNRQEPNVRESDY